MSKPTVYTVRIRSFVNGLYAGEREEQRADCTRCGTPADPSEIEGNGGLCYSCVVREDEEDDL